MLHGAQVAGSVFLVVEEGADQSDHVPYGFPVPDVTADVLGCLSVAVLIRVLVFVLVTVDGVPVEVGLTGPETVEVL